MNFLFVSAADSGAAVLACVEKCLQRLLQTPAELGPGSRQRPRAVRRLRNIEEPF